MKRIIIDLDKCCPSCPYCDADMADARTGKERIRCKKIGSWIDYDPNVPGFPGNCPLPEFYIKCTNSIAIPPGEGKPTVVASPEPLDIDNKRRNPFQ